MQKSHPLPDAVPESDVQECQPSKDARKKRTHTTEEEFVLVTNKVIFAFTIYLASSRMLFFMSSFPLPAQSTSPHPSLRKLP